MTTATRSGTTVEFDEFDRRGRLVTLGSDAARSLSQSGLVEVLPAGRDRWRIVPFGRVGSVRVDDLSVRVVPAASLGLTQLFFLLDHAADDAFLASGVSARDDDELWTSVADALAALARQALMAGPLRGYRRVDEALSTVRGRIRMGDQIRRRPGQMLPLEVSYSEFTPDIPENRIVRTAAHRLLHLADLPDHTRRALALVDARLADATLVAPGAPVPSWTPTRLNERYRDVLRLAERVVRSMSVEVDDGDASTAAFVTEMPGLFESFVAAELTAALNTGGGRLHHDPLVHLDSGGGSAVEGGTGAARHRATDVAADHLSVRTGLVYEADGEPVTTFVPTYPVDRRARTAEHYRLLAAATALGVRQAYLVYPAQRRDAVATPRHIVHTDISLVEYPIDLSAGPAGCRAQLSELAERARILARENATGERTEGRRHAR